MEEAGTHIALDRSKDMGYTGLRATSAMAMFEQTGLKEVVDSASELDSRRKLTPGNVVKAFIGDIMRHADRRALSRVSDPFLQALN